MKDNRIIRVLRALRDHATGKMETYWNGLTPRRRKRIVYGLLALFFLIDVYHIVKGVCGGSGVDFGNIEPINR